MRLLFVHQNFPGQYRHLAAHFAARPGCEVVALGEKRRLLRNAPHAPGIRACGYELPGPEAAGFDASLLNALRRGKAAAAAATRLAMAGFRPDLVFVHIGWGEALFLKDVFPVARIVLYCEFFYRSRGADLGFDPEFPASPEKRLRVRVMNAPLLMSLDASDAGVAPTRWQQRQFPELHARRINVIHEGIDTERVAPPQAPREPELVTYVARNLEPYRGFHSFMRAIPRIQRLRPKARIVIVGGEEVSYSPRPPSGETYKARLLRELDGRIDLSRVEFRGRVPYAQYLELLRASSVHVYLTYPFVLSWSLLEAMASGCLIVGSRTPPVEEVIRDGENGLLADFLSPEGIAERVAGALERQRELEPLRKAARRTVLANYDLARVCLPAQVRLAEALLGGRPASLRAA
jgi:glycosyltransferase involved in cell wall biosynthesis